ncbi:cyclopropane fatty acyl phospholipid synthase [Granulosicoccaceae sp. 1_MG-2023]|nr:cyclopropane fatty acyl phospholipid synthase [Granulosicoccaceae sp. 1_MG-2023]
MRLHNPIHLQEDDHAPAPPAILESLANTAGIRFNGPDPWDIQVHDPQVYSRILHSGSLGFGEAYVDGLWDCDSIDALFHRLLTADIDTRLGGLAKLHFYAEALKAQLLNLQSRSRAFQVGEQHYDIGNDVYEAMLDPSMSYSCAYWECAVNLADAQLHKLDMICQKLQLQPGEKLLEIGCGWGGLARHAARHYGVEVTGITVSREQKKLAEEMCRGLPVKIELIDYRDLQGRYDKIVSVGMFEHVGPKNYAVYFDTAKRLLKDDGLFLLHTIGIHKTSPAADPWIHKYIFRNGKLPSAEEIAIALNDRFLIEDWHNFGQDYDRTLMAWWHNFDAAWPELRHRYSPQFRRQWKYYLQSCAGIFRARRGQLWQLVLSKRERQGTYRSIRHRNAL